MLTQSRARVSLPFSWSQPVYAQRLLSDNLLDQAAHVILVPTLSRATLADHIERVRAMRSAQARPQLARLTERGCTLKSAAREDGYAR